MVREKDLTPTHTLVNLQGRRNAGLVDTRSEQVALAVVKETDAGIVVLGRRMLATLGPLSDEIAVYRARTHMLPAEARRQSSAFTLANDTQGLEFLCRESFDRNRPTFEHPLGSRFEEMDCLVFFDKVLGSQRVPHVQERVGEIIRYLETLRACLRAAAAVSSGLGRRLQRLRRSADPVRALLRWGPGPEHGLALRKIRQGTGNAPRSRVPG